MPQNATNGNLLIMTITKALVALIIVATLSYCTISQIAIDSTVITLLFGVLGAKEIVSGIIYNSTRK
jgi:hypothetical protein